MVSSVLMQTIIVTVLPIISNQLGHEELYGWVISAYMISSTITIPLFANLSDIYGRKHFYLWGMVVFLLGSMLSGGSHTMLQLITFRTIQGLGAGAVAPSAIAMISELFNPDKRAKMLGVLSAVQVLANIIGPLLGGIITDMYSWRWTFFINLPIGLIAIIFVNKNYFNQSNHMKKKKNIDYLGSMALGLFIILVILLFQIKVKSFLSLERMIILFLVILVFVFFVKQEKKHVNPVFSLDLIRLKHVKLSFLSMLLLGTIVYGMITILPLYGQSLFGNQALVGGKILLFFSMGIGIGGIISGSLTKRFKLSRILSTGWLLSIVGLTLLILTRIYMIQLSLAFIFVLIIGIGLGINLPLILATSQNAVTENKRAIVAGIIQISRNIGGAVGIPIFANFIIFDFNISQGLNNFAVIFVLMSFVALVGLFIGVQFKEDR